MGHEASSNSIDMKNWEVIKIRELTLIPMLLLGLVLATPLSIHTAAQPRTDFYGSGDSGAAYEFCLDWMYPKRNVGIKPAPAPTKPTTAKVKPLTSYDGSGDSGAAYDFYLDWMSPRIKPKTPRIIRFLTFNRSYDRGQAFSENE